MLTHAYILGINPKGPLMEPNALQLWGLSRAWGGGSVAGGDMSGPLDAKPGVKESWQAASKDKQSNQRVHTKGLGKRQSPDAGSGPEPGTPDGTKQTASGRAVHHRVHHTPESSKTSAVFPFCLAERCTDEAHGSSGPDLDLFWEGERFPFLFSIYVLNIQYNVFDVYSKRRNSPQGYRT